MELNKQDIKEVILTIIEEKYIIDRFFFENENTMISSELNPNLNNDYWFEDLQIEINKEYSVFIEQEDLDIFTLNELVNHIYDQLYF